MRLKGMQLQNGQTLYTFYCPGCKGEHAVDSTWQFNGSFERPTFSPSILYREFEHPTDDSKPTHVCHSYVKDGRIQFLGDCTHPLANQTVDLPTYPT